jgi:hypothetical protein
MVLSVILPEGGWRAVPFEDISSDLYSAGFRDHQFPLLHKILSLMISAYCFHLGEKISPSVV